MGETRGTYGVEAKYIQGFLWVNFKEGDHSEDLGIDGRLLLKC
jgi:hypothetical protein